MANAIELKSNVRAVAWAAAALVTVGLSACGGGGTTGEVVTGRVMDGYINGASVCFDTNANGACDPGEPMAETADGGVFTMTVPEGAAGQPHMLVDVPVGAVDLDDPENPIQAAYKMRGLVAASAVISPLTTMQAAYIDAGMSPAEAAAQVKTDLRLAELAVDQDYVAAGNVQTHNVARVLAGVLQAAPQMTATELRTDLSKLAATVAPAFDSLTPISNADVEERVNDWVGTNRPSAPTAGATAPTVAAANVLSIYSDTYTSPAGVNLNPGWGQATVTTQEDLGDGKVVKMVGLNYQGIELPVQNITAYSKLHVDIWSAAAGSVNLGLITSAAQTGGDAKETQVAITLQAGWNSVELDLARFTAPDLSKIDQLIWVAEGSPTIYYDNLYFWGESVGGGGSTQPESPEPAAAPTEGAPEPGIAAANVLSIYSDAYTSLSGVNLNPGWGQATVTTQEGLADGSVVKMAGLNYQGIELPVQNVSAYSKLHVDVWSPAAGSVKLGLITSGDQTGGDAKETQLPITLKAGWNSVNLDLSSFTAPDMTKIDQLIWVAEGAPTLYYDNLYFWGEDVGGGGGNTSQPDPAPSTGAPTPSVAAANVLSVYSDAYTPISGVNVNPGWGQATVTTQEALGTGSVIKMAGLNYQGIEMPVQDVSAYSKLHVDVWSPAAGSVKLSLITSAKQAGSGTAKETQVSITLQAGWNSVELNLSDFTAPDKSMIDQLMWVAEGSPTLYYDNLYFWGENVGGGGSSEGTPVTEGNLLVNGDFEQGPTGWFANYNDSNTPEIRTTDGNSYFFADVPSAGSPWAVGLSNALTLESGATYKLMFTASTGEGNTRGLRAGIGQNYGSYDSAYKDLTLTSESKTFELTLTAPGGSENGRVFFDMGDAVGVVVIDNVSLVKEVADSGAAPAVAATTPPARNAQDVVSIFSDAYDDLTVASWGPNWGDSSARITDTTVAGNAVKVVEMKADQTFAGISFTGAKFDASAFTMMHLDYWIPAPLNAGQVVNIKLSNHDGDRETSAIQTTITSPTTGQWASVDIALSEFVAASTTENLSRNALAEIVISAARADLKQPVTIYLDNVYFY